jgi:hypothetical protein
VENVAKKCAQNFLVREPEGKRPLGDLGVDEILKWILKK